MDKKTFKKALEIENRISFLNRAIDRLDFFAYELDTHKEIFNTIVIKSSKTERLYELAEGIMFSENIELPNELTILNFIRKLKDFYLGKLKEAQGEFDSL